MRIYFKHLKLLQEVWGARVNDEDTEAGHFKEAKKPSGRAERALHNWYTSSVITSIEHKHSI